MVIFALLIHLILLLLVCIELSWLVLLQVLACDLQNVANEILLGVEDALAIKKKEYVEKSSLNIKTFSNEDNIVVRYLLVATT